MNKKDYVKRIKKRFTKQTGKPVDGENIHLFVQYLLDLSFYNYKIAKQIATLAKSKLNENH